MSSLKDATVLVVDDEADLRDLLAVEFRLRGSAVFAASNGWGATAGLSCSAQSWSHSASWSRSTCS